MSASAVAGGLCTVCCGNRIGCRYRFFPVDRTAGRHRDVPDVMPVTPLRRAYACVSAAGPHAAHSTVSRAQLIVPHPLTGGKAAAGGHEEHAPEQTGGESAPHCGPLISGGHAQFKKGSRLLHEKQGSRGGISSS